MNRSRKYSVPEVGICEAVDMQAISGRLGALSLFHWAMNTAQNRVHHMLTVAHLDALNLSKNSLTFRPDAKDSIFPFSGLTRTQCKFYRTNGYLVVPGALATSRANELLDETDKLMKRVSQGDEGIILHDLSRHETKGLSPVGRIFATFEPG